MRLHGTLRSWNDDRGFGFIAQANGEADVFLHISELPRDGTRPTTGEKLTYEMGRGVNGKPQAVNVIRLAIGDTRKIKRVPPAQHAGQSKIFSKAIVLIMLLSLGAYGYKHYKQKAAVYSNATNASPALAVPAPVQDNVANGFNCDGRTQCSQMTSCTEAKNFLRHCQGTEMDGNHDGTPCEQQWCTSPFAK